MPGHTLTFVMMFGVGITISTLMQRIRGQELEARRPRRAHGIALIFTLLARARRRSVSVDAIAEVVASQVSAIFHSGVAVIVPDGQG